MKISPCGRCTILNKTTQGFSNSVAATSVSSRESNAVGNRMNGVEKEEKETHRKNVINPIFFFFFYPPYVLLLVLLET